MANRREFLTLLGLGVGASTLTLWPSLTSAATGGNTRLLVLMLRGGLDGVHAVPPYGDPGYTALRGPLALSPAGPTAAGAAALKLDATFALHPSLGFLAGQYALGRCLPIVAAAPPYWGRSHFEAQECVENGTDTPNGAETGWLNRAAGALHEHGLSVTSVTPLMMRGPSKIDSWSPPLPMHVNPILLQRLESLYAEDPRLATAFADAIAQQHVDASIDRQMAAQAPGAAAPKVIGMRLGVMLRAAGTFMARPGGPRICFVEDYGWDTHANQAPILSRKLAELDQALAALHDAAAPVWDRTAAVVVTEFGRTARINGTNGTDHGTGGAMFVLGGAVNGGRIGGEWPGMQPDRLYENRDIHATTDQRQVFKGLLGEHLGLSPAVLATRIFPNSTRVPPLAGLIGTPAVRALG
ncbi:MAG TPA: DUF1501 domain-containing protein [Steroidobacteraceae bacterium]|nr:DUF1501 domain-containing protein [Steroidobacteraceae bacterium]